MSQSQIIAGIADHCGWAVFVCVGARKQRGALVPEVLHRAKLELLAPGLPKLPFHNDTHGMELARAEAVVAAVRESALEYSRRALEQLRSACDGTLTGIALRKPPLDELPSVEDANTSPYINTRADSVLYLQALGEAAAKLGLAVEWMARGTERKLAAKCTGTDAEELDQWLEGMRAQLGAPWQKDHQDATARALAALGTGVKLALG